MMKSNESPMPPRLIDNVFDEQGGQTALFHKAENHRLREENKAIRIRAEKEYKRVSIKLFFLVFLLFSN